MLHHVELWVPDLERAVRSWGWLLERLGCEPYQEWPHGRSWRRGETYLVVEQSPALKTDSHDRLRPGLNHLAFHVPDRTEPRACPADHAGDAGLGTPICGVVVTRRRSASTPSSALQLDAPSPAHLR
ncbi:VOC family protein [Streptomyces sp. S1D4-11]|nr:VOC family protein [Streptomyces sp. S1D4-11]QIY98082.1 hypothetical protein HEP87_34095 [Streptomyces sp. S1D4-11]